MKCRACDAILTDFESTIRLAASGDFLDLCGKCRSTIISDLDTSERYDLYDPDLDILDMDAESTDDETRPSLPAEDDDS